MTVLRAQSPLQAEPGDAEVRVLVYELEIASIVGGFRYAPRNAFAGAVFDLPVDDQAIGFG